MGPIEAVACVVVIFGTPEHPDIGQISWEVDPNVRTEHLVVDENGYDWFWTEGEAVITWPR